MIAHYLIKSLTAIITVFVLFSEPILADSRIVAIQSVLIKPYVAALRGFDSVCSETLTRITLSETSRWELSRVIEKESPELIVAVGLSALDAALAFEDLPVLYCMVLPQDVSGIRRENVTGVFMRVPVEDQLNHVSAVLPGVKRIGVLYDPKQSSGMIADAQVVSERLEIEIMAEAVETPRQISDTLPKLTGRVGVIWMLPDITVSKPSSMELFTLFSLENRIPLVVYSEKYLEKGAFMSIALAPYDMGRQTGEMAKAILSGEDISTLGPRDAQVSSVTINRTVARKFGIVIDMAGANEFKVID